MTDKGMIAIRESFVVQAEPAAVWDVIRQPAAVAECVPGAILTENTEDGQLKGAIRVKFGPTLVAFRGEATVRYDDAQRICTIESRGSDQRNTSRARAEGVVTVTSNGSSTDILVEGAFQVSGALGSFARTGGVHLARELLSDFAKNLSQRLAKDEPSAATAIAANESRPQASISAGSLLTRVVVGWFKSIFAGRKGGK